MAAQAVSVIPLEDYRLQVDLSVPVSLKQISQVIDTFAQSLSVIRIAYIEAVGIDCELKRL